MIAAGGQPAVDVDQVLHARHLGRQDDPVVRQAGLLGQLGRTDRRFEHGRDHHLARVVRLERPGVLVHQPGEEILVERAPVDADADRLPFLDGDSRDRPEVGVAALRADVPRVDAVLVESARHRRVLRQEPVAVVVEIPDDRHADAETAHLAHDLGDGRGGRVVVDGDPHQLAAGVGEGHDLERGRVGVGRVGVGHRLDGDRVATADRHAADEDGRGRAPAGEVGAALCGRLGRRGVHGPAPAARSTSKMVTQSRKPISSTKPMK